jgi:hypothetical protein
VLERLEEVVEDDDLPPVVAWLAGPEVDDRGAVRRALLLLAAGGDPHRSLELDGRAVTALAADLDSPERRRALGAGLAALPVEGLPRVAAAVARLLGDPDLAWRAYAAGVLGAELAD